MKKCKIIGAGLVGSLLSSLLVKLGYTVEVYEKRKDPRGQENFKGRSINLALSHRGLQALRIANLHEQILEKAIPMKGRMVHVKDTASTNLQPYSADGSCIYSISRFELNCTLISQAEQQGVSFLFETEFTPSLTNSEELIFACDGIHSVTRNELKNNKEQKISLSHDYMEFEISAKNAQSLFTNALHIWPNGHHMFIALPNQDNTYTCTLFLDKEGEVSFEKLKNTTDVQTFFESFYPEIVSLIPDYIEQCLNKPSSPLAYLLNSSWVENKTLLVGDAAHAIVPFYGQGMNAGFEDCRVIYELLQKGGEDKLLSDYEEERKANGDAICELALQNFVEMRDSVINPEYLRLRNKEAEIKKQDPNWLSQYEMVTFTDIPYKDCLTKGKEQRKYLQSLLNG